MRLSVVKHSPIHKNRRLDNIRAVSSEERICIDIKNIVLAVSAAFSPEIEIRVIGNVDRTDCIGCGRVINFPCPRLCQCICHIYVQVPGKTFCPVRMETMECQRTVCPGNEIPDYRIQPLETTMKHAFAVMIGGKPICPAPISIRSSDYAVGYRSHDSTEKPLPLIVHILVQSPVPKNDIHRIAVSVWNRKRHDTTAIVCRLKDNVSAGNSPESCFLAVNDIRKIIRTDLSRHRRT